MILSEVLTKTKEHFKKLGISSANLDAELLLAHGLGFKRMDLFLKSDYPMNSKELEACRELVRRRQKGEPVAYILGTKAFYNIELIVNPAVLIPRPETEHIVDEALSWIKKNPKEQYFVLDLGAGSGCIGLALAKEDARVKLLAIEKSEAACGVWEENFKRNDLSNECQVLNIDIEDLRKEKLMELGFSSIDIVVANPPYISESDEEIENEVKSFEPKEALFAKNEGLHCYETWPYTFSSLMAEENISLWEIGHKQAKAVSEIFLDTELFESVETIKDYSSKDRIVKAIYKSN